ncbi:hypothetical protein [Proteiniphilum propionicum]|uniref:hypothetical protein n=1 Tax=Proteiniphilum propionicum TaxID=2829812 RepID=UPI001EEA637B|nr:hypothetical protein [Proteiniphilum propionicum]ULB33451.1 hypothetical protein KDN43_10485 [Proteiniphilum propionicum]
MDATVCDADIKYLTELDLLNDIRARLSSTSNSWIGAIIFVMNLIRHMRAIPLPYFVSLLLNQMKVRNINIYPIRLHLNFCA